MFSGELSVNEPEKKKVKMLYNEPKQKYMCIK